MKVKFLGYAYPSSPIAKSTGFGKQGCWYLAAFDNDYPQNENDVVYACLTFEDAIAMSEHAFNSGMPWDRYSMHNMNEVK